MELFGCILLNVERKTLKKNWLKVYIPCFVQPQFPNLSQILTEKKGTEPFLSVNVFSDLTVNPFSREYEGWTFCVRYLSTEILLRGNVHFSLRPCNYSERMWITMVKRGHLRWVTKEDESLKMSYWRITINALPCFVCRERICYLLPVVVSVIFVSHCLLVGWPIPIPITSGTCLCSFRLKMRKRKKVTKKKITS